MLAFRSSAGVTPVRWFLAGAVACFLAGVVAMPEPAYAEGGKGRVRIKKKTRLTRDSGDGEEYNQARAEALAAKRNALIFDIKRFLSTARDNDQKAELNLRLANLYREEYVANLAKAQSEFDQAMANFEKVQAKNPKAKAPVLDTTEALASLDRARGIYKDLLKQYPQHPRRDEMLFFLAQSSIDRGLNDEAMQYYKILLSEFPESRFSPDALVQLGDNYFDKNQWEQAETYYDEVMKRNFTPLLNYVHWRKGWCAYNTGRNAQAVQHFRWVVDNEDTIENTPIRVKNEALKDIALPFVELGVTDQAVAFYSMQGDHQNRRGLEAMASLYVEKGNPKNGIFFYEHLLNLDANHPKNPDYDVSIAEALRAMGNMDGAVERIVMRYPLYAPKSNWHEVNHQDPKITKNAFEKFEETARKYAFMVHAEGQKTQRDTLYESAKKLYLKYIEYFPRTPHTSKIRFYLAEIYFRQKNFLPSADNYYLVYQDTTADGKMRLAAIEYALKALDHKLNNDRKEAGLTTIDKKATAKLTQAVDAELKQTPYTEAETKFIAIADVFLEVYPKHKEAPFVLYEQAYLRYVHFDFADAYRSFWKLVQEYERHEMAKPSAYLIMDILNRRKDYAKLVAACKRFLELRGPAFKELEFRKETSKILRQAELKRIEQIEKKGEYKIAADMYIEYTKQYGSQDEVLFEKALYNASVNYRRAALLLPAVEAQEQFLRRFPKSNYRKEMLLQVAKTYESLGILDKSGAYFEVYATTYPQDKEASTALRLAGLYHWGSGNVRRGEAALLQYLKSYPNDTALVDNDLLMLYQTTGAVDKQVGFRDLLRKRKGIHPAEYMQYSIEIAEIFERQGQDKFAVLGDVIKFAQRYAKEIVSKPEGAEALSKLRLWIAQQKEDLFVSLKLQLPQENLEATLQKKLALMKELENEFSQIAALGNPDSGLAAIFKTANAYRHMAQAVLSAPVPSELTGEQMELYRAELNKQLIKPFNDRAAAMAAQCLEKAQEFNVISAWTAKCYSLASEMNPDRYPPVRTAYLPPQQLALLLPPPLPKKGEERKSTDEGGDGGDPTISTPQERIPLGTVKFYLYPFYSSALFKPLDKVDPAAAEQAAGGGLPDLEGRSAEKTKSEGVRPLDPITINYAALSEERKKLLKQALENEKPADSRRPKTFAYLNLMRLAKPQAAIPMVLKAIETDPENPALHNLLALCYFESENWSAARVTWLSMIAREMKHAAVWNNLGVVAMLEGNESMAMALWREAAGLPNAREAHLNLGFSALKYRNGFEAKKRFEAALALEPNDAAAQVGYEVGRLQNREIDVARDRLATLTKKLKRDPYARLSFGYMLLDAEKDPELAFRVLREYVDSIPGDADVPIRAAMSEARAMAQALARQEAFGGGAFDEREDADRSTASQREAADSLPGID
jgi:TolA-binding protein/Flp pilus assembly protein TadD